LIVHTASLFSSFTQSKSLTLMLFK